VGKSCILSRFCENKFSDAFYNTIGVDFVRISSCRKLKPFCWKARSANCKSGILLARKDSELSLQTTISISFSIQRRTWHFGRLWCYSKVIVSKPCLLAWLDRQVLRSRYRHNNSHSTAILIGNKADLEEKRKVSEDEGYEFAKKNKLDFIESSAYSSANINLVF
jgi:GTPase SAR1 family protein